MIRHLLWSVQFVLFLAVLRAIWSDFGAQIADVIIGYLFSGVKHQFRQYLVSASLHVIGANMGLETEPDSADLTRLQHRHLVTEPFGGIDRENVWFHLQTHSQDVLSVITWASMLVCRVVRRPS